MSSTVTVGNKRWGVISILTLAYTFMYFGRSAMSVVGPTIMKEYHWTGTQFGMVSTAFFIGYAMTMLPSGWLADHFGATRVIVTGTLLWAAFTFLCPWGATVSITVFMLLRIVVGIGQGTTLPTAGSLVSKWMPRKEAGRAQGVVMIGTPLGTALTMVIGVHIIRVFGWQTIFWSFTFLGPIWCLLWWKFGSNSPDHHPTITKEEIDYIRADQGAAPGSALAPLLPNSTIFTNTNVWAATISYCCYNYVFYLLLTWLPTYLAMGRGFTLVKSGYYTACPYFVAIFTYPLGGMLCDWAANKWGQNFGRKLFPVLGLIVGGVLLYLGASAPNAITAVILISAAMGFLTLTQGAFFSIPNVFAPRNAGTIIGLFGFIGTMAGISAPIITGMIVDNYGYNYALFLGAAMAVLGAFIMLFFCKVKQLNPPLQAGD